jgi:hypothetical protein
LDQAPSFDANQRLLLELIQQLGQKNNRHKPKAPDVDTFHGERSKFSDFEMQIRLKLEADEDMYDTNRARVMYVINRLRGDPARWARPYYDAKYTPELKPLPAFEDFMSELCRAYGDPDERATAERDIQRLRQKGRSLATYCAELHHLATILKLNDEAQKVHFFNGIDDHIHDWLSYQVDADSWTMETLVNQCIKYDNNRHRRKNTPSLFRTQSASSSSHTSSQTPPRTYTSQKYSYTSQAPRTQNPQPPQPQPPRPQQQQPSQWPPSSFGQAQGQGYYGPMAMELGQVGPKGKVPPHERVRRFNEGGCFRCGEIGHFAVNCPLKTQPRPRPQLPQNSQSRSPFNFQTQQPQPQQPQRRVNEIQIHDKDQDDVASVMGGVDLQGKE